MFCLCCDHTRGETNAWQFWSIRTQEGADTGTTAAVEFISLVSSWKGYVPTYVRMYVHTSHISSIPTWCWFYSRLFRGRGCTHSYLVILWVSSLGTGNFSGNFLAHPQFSGNFLVIFWVSSLEELNPNPQRPRCKKNEQCDSADNTTGLTELAVGTQRKTFVFWKWYSTPMNLGASSPLGLSQKHLPQKANKCYPCRSRRQIFICMIYDLYDM